MTNDRAAGDRPWHRRHRLAVDVTIAVGFVLLDTGMTLADATWWPDRPGTLAWVMLGVQALACASLAVRRIAPLTVVGVLGAFTLAVSLLNSPMGLLTPAHQGNVWAPVSTVLAAYGPLFYQQNRRTAYFALAAFTLVVMRPWDPSTTNMTIGLLRTAVGPLLALYFDTRRRLMQALVDRAERAERERHLVAEQARTEERARLAGEMHDVVTHRVSLMVLQAGALKVTAPDAATGQAAEELRTAGCQALEELRDLVGILRTTPEGDGTAAVADFADLVAESVAVGISTELIEEGDPSLASPVVGRTAYHVLREALTNVRKHAPGARVQVRVKYDNTQVRLMVHNTPPTGSPRSALAETGSGLGIAHLRRRIELVHGTLRAEPCSGGGFSVEATLPAFVPTSESAV
ncbi:sensor histidine kinase [Streptomyces noursei]|uniref:sensor histidine kinase n=1 Tax=Streptomyces noursei TaxID=1971 RepID=UPI0016734DF0|nr:histidine kinase [Streptomyces noursei]MCZ1012822.1 histidine kinase [Streptomyces noursei]